MATPMILAPVDGDDPCGDDLKWDMEFMTLMQEYETLFLHGNQGVVGDATAAEGQPDSRDFFKKLEGLCGRTKDLRLLAVRAEALWRTQGLVAFGNALEDLVAAAALWPDPASGIHPRADEYDNDLGERVAPLGKLLHVAPVLASSLAWGGNPTVLERTEATAVLQGVFDAWQERLEPAFGDELPSRTEAWSAIKELLPIAGAQDEDGAPGESAAQEAMPPPADAWDLIERAAELLATQDRHSPALPVLHLLLIWRSRDILDIAEGMRQSGLTMEQLLDSVRKQINAT